jgi:hypothetical protein
MPAERHDRGLIAFGLALCQRAEQMTHLGRDTPLDTLADAIATPTAARSRAHRDLARALRAHPRALRRLAHASA